MTLLYLVRHGENDWTGKRLPGWHKGIHLNSRGKAQAEALAGAFEGIRLAAVYSSPLERTVETAAPLARARKLRVRLRPGLGEIRVGAWEGRSLAALRKLKVWSVVQRAPSLMRFPGGESFAEVQARMVSELEGLRERHPKATIVCFSHADPIRLAIAYYIGLPIDSFQRLSIAPASISLLALTADHCRLLLFNDSRAAGSPAPG
jgi:probable phosphoglycerate mutase